MGLLGKVTGGLAKVLSPVATVIPGGTMIAGAASLASTLDPDSEEYYENPFGADPYIKHGPLWGIPTHPTDRDNLRQRISISRQPEERDIGDPLHPEELQLLNIELSRRGVRRVYDEVWNGSGAVRVCRTKYEPALPTRREVFYLVRNRGAAYRWTKTPIAGKHLFPLVQRVADMAADPPKAPTFAEVDRRSYRRWLYERWSNQAERYLQDYWKVGNGPPHADFDGWLKTSQIEARQYPQKYKAHQAAMDQLEEELSAEWFAWRESIAQEQAKQALLQQIEDSSSALIDQAIRGEITPEAAGFTAQQFAAIGINPPPVPEYLPPGVVSQIPHTAAPEVQSSKPAPVPVTLGLGAAALLLLI